MDNSTIQILAVILTSFILIVFYSVQFSQRLHSIDNDLLRRNNCQSNYESFRTEMIDPNFSFMPSRCLFGQTTSIDFKANLNEIFQPKHFQNITCIPVEADLSPTPLTMTALASYPGSGNTWSRYLIEQLTGMRTSSVYCDKKLQVTFPAECIHNKEYAVCTKTHRFERESFQRAIVIMRNPYDAIFAQFNFKHGGHVGSASFDLLKSKVWTDFPNYRAYRWQMFYMYWLHFNESTHILWYDKLIRDGFYEEMYEVANFLEVPLTYERLWCLGQNREGNWHRKVEEQIVKMDTLYPESLRSRIDDIVESVDNYVYKKFEMHVPFKGELSSTLRS